MQVSGIKKALMTLSILVVLSFFVFYAIDTFYEAPKWDQYCDNSARPVLDKGLETQATCEESGGKWNPRDYTCPPDETGTTSCPDGWCDLNYYCQKEYDAVNEVYERNVFFISMIVGIALLVAGLIMQGASVSTGIMGGGIVTLFIGLVRYWGYLSKYWRLGILGIVLALLIYVGYTKVDQIKTQAKPKKRSSTRKKRK